MLATLVKLRTSLAIERAPLLLAVVLQLVLVGAARGDEPSPIRVGIVGLDAHAVPWTMIVTNPRTAPEIRAMQIVAAVPTYSDDIPFSANHIQANIAAMRKLNVEIVDTVEDLLPKVDAVMVLSIDGRKHLEQVRPIFAARKPVFIDKPVAASLADVLRVYDLARESETPCFSSSALRYGATTVQLLKEMRVGQVLGCDAYSSNAQLEPSHPDLFYYGIHGCELLFTVMGSGCKTVTRLQTPTADMVSGEWADGRVGTFRGIRQGQVSFGALVFGSKAIAPSGGFEGYEPLLQEIALFFRTKTPPVTVEQTVEIYAFMEAADESKRQGGAVVTLESVLKQARESIASQKEPE